jgi:hypothetical protein
MHRKSAAIMLRYRAMMPNVAELPDDIDTLEAMALATVEKRVTMEAENSRIACRPSAF